MTDDLQLTTKKVSNNSHLLRLMTDGCRLTTKKVIFVTMRFLRSSIFLHQLLSLILVITILNVSIDPPDLLKNLDNDIALEEDVSVNEMESISEVVLEKVLDLHNAVPETDDEDAETLLKKVEISEHYYTLAVPEAQVTLLPYPSQHSITPQFTEQISLNVSSPPPWA